MYLTLNIFYYHIQEIKETEEKIKIEVGKLEVEKQQLQ